MTRRDLAAAVGLLLVAVALTAGSWGTTTRWHPDSLFYQAQLLEVRGVERGEALRSVLHGPLAEGVAAAVGDPEWVAYNQGFYRRRWLVPALGAAVTPVLGSDSLQAVSLVGYVLLGPVLLLLLRRRFGTVVGAVAALVCISLPPLRSWAAQPLTDSFGVLLFALGLLGAALVLDRGLRWLPLWVGAVLALGFTRDATIALVAAAGWMAVMERSKRTAWLLVGGVLAALPAPLLFGASLRRSLALIVNEFDVPQDTGWGAVLDGYPAALWRLVRGDVESLTRVTPLTGAVVVVALVALVWRRRSPDPYFRLMRAAAAGCLLMLLLQPNRTGLRLELVFVPVLAVGLALALEPLVAALRSRWGGPRATQASSTQPDAVDPSQGRRGVEDLRA